MTLEEPIRILPWDCQERVGKEQLSFHQSSVSPVILLWVPGGSSLPGIDGRLNTKKDPERQKAGQSLADLILIRGSNRDVLPSRGCGAMSVDIFVCHI